MGKVPEIIMYKKIGTFSLGLALGLSLSPAISVSSQRYDFLRLYSKVFNLVESSYVEAIDEKKMVINSVRGLLGGLDPYSAYLEKEDFKDFQSETLGRFGGLGIEVIMEGGFLQIISPIEDSPAEKAGIKPGDRIISIDGEVVRGLDIAEASKKLRGKIGTTIVLTVKREGTAKLLNYKIKRDKITIRSVKTKVLDAEKGIYYVRITSFLEQTSKDFKKFIAKTAAKNEKISGLVIDLRGNPGGLLKQAVEMADLFIESGDIVSTIGRNKEQKNVLHAAQEGTLDSKIKLTVLIDEGSASASEILAGALKDHGRARILGQKSYGKGSVQSVIPLENGDGVKLTIAKYYSPKGHVIDKKGVMPDVELKTVKEEYKLKDIQNDPWVIDAIKELN
jgi:carboxyl-terminal processing protease